MKHLFRDYNLLGIILCVLIFTACEKDDNNAYIYGTNSVVNYLENDPEYSLFVEAIEKAGLYNSLDGNSGSYTVFAPNNEAVEDYLAENNLESFEELDESELLRLVEYHILSILTPREGFTTGYSPTLAAIPVNDSTDANLSLFVKNTIDDVEFNGKIKITESDISVDNGLVHKVDHILVPPTLKIFMEADENLNAYYEKITASGVSINFEELLADTESRTTILVPNEFAVEEFFSDQGNGMSAEELDRLYNYHLLDTVRLFQTLGSGYLTTKAKEDFSGQNHKLNLHLNLETGVNLNGGTSVVISDLMTVNGNIQVVDEFLSLPTLETFIKSDSRLARFSQALGDSLQESQAYFDILKQLPNEGDSPYTVFAPDNDAFQDLTEVNLPGDDEDNEDEDDEETDNPIDEPTEIDSVEMTDILNLHIVKNMGLRSENFSNQTLNTLGDPINIDGAHQQVIDPTGEESQIIETNIQTSNGVLHLIDRVLRPYFLINGLDS